MTQEEIAVKFEHQEQEIKSLKHRMKDCEDAQSDFGSLLRSVDRLAVNMEFMAQEQRKQGEKIDKQSEKIEKLEHEPAEDFKHYKRVIIGCIVTGVLGALVGAILTLIIKGV